LNRLSDRFLMVIEGKKLMFRSYAVIVTSTGPFSDRRLTRAWPEPHRLVMPS
jgi:hypothetical protein